MANVCAICAKGVVTGFQVSHSHIRTKRTWKPNLQRVHAIVNGTPSPDQSLHPMLTFRQSSAR